MKCINVTPLLLLCLTSFSLTFDYCFVSLPNSDSPQLLPPLSVHHRYKPSLCLSSIHSYAVLHGRFGRFADHQRHSFTPKGRLAAFRLQICHESGLRGSCDGSAANGHAKEYPHRLNSPHLSPQLLKFHPRLFQTARGRINLRSGTMPKQQLLPLNLLLLLMSARLHGSLLHRHKEPAGQRRSQQFETGCFVLLHNPAGGQQ